MAQRTKAQRGMLAAGLFFLLWLAWQALRGGFRQLARAHTHGQTLQTVLQVECALFSVLVALTQVTCRGWARPIQTAWNFLLASSAGLSGLVWGPSMPLVAGVFTGATLIIARGVRWVLNTPEAS